MTRSTMLASAAAAMIFVGPLAAAPAVDPEAVKTVQTLYGTEIARVAATAATDDDVVLAKELLAAAQTQTTAPAVVGVLCDHVYHLAGKAPAGYDSAVAAMQLGASRVPGRRAEFLDRLLSLFQGRLMTSSLAERKELSKTLLETMLEHADAVAETISPAQAIPLYMKAMTMAGRVNSPLRDAIGQKLRAARQRDVLMRQIRSYKITLEATPDDPRANQELLRIYLIQLDDPQQAARYVQFGGGDDSRRYVPLAALPTTDDVPSADRLGLADFYRRLADQADTAVRPNMLRRAAAYYEAFLASDSTDALARVKSQAALTQLQKELGDDAAKPVSIATGPGSPTPTPTSTAPAPGAVTPVVIKPAPPGAKRQISADIVAWAQQTWALTPDEQIQALLPKLRQVNGGREFLLKSRQVNNGNIESLNLGGNKGLEYIDPLVGMPLVELDLSGCSDLKDLAALRGMKLTRLNLSGCAALTSLDDLKGMPLVELDLRGCTGLTGDLSALAGMKLRSLSLSGCTSLESLNGVQGMPVTYAYLDNCKSLKGDLSVLKGLPITMLQLDGCESLTSLNGIQGMKLSGRRGLSIQNCKGLKGDLRALEGMAFTDLNITGCTSLESLHGIEGMPLTRLTAQGCSSLVVDANLLRGTKLTSLHVDGARAILNLPALAALPLSTLNIDVQQKPTDNELLAVLTRITSLRRISTGDRSLDQRLDSRIRRKN